MSALNNPKVVEAKLKKELNANRFAGPYSSPPFPVFRVSLLKVVPKKNPGEFRLIYHLSFPQRNSVNDGILPEGTNVLYATIEDAIRLTKKIGPVVFWRVVHPDIIILC